MNVQKLLNASRFVETEIFADTLPLSSQLISQPNCHITRKITEKLKIQGSTLALVKIRKTIDRCCFLANNQTRFPF